MKKLGKVLIWILVVFFMFLGTLAVLIGLHGKRIVVSQVEKNLNMKATLGSIRLSMPFSVNLTDMEIGRLFKVESISASPNILALFAGKVVLSNLTLTNPVVNLELLPNGTLNLPNIQKKGKQPPVYVTGIVIQNGKIIFTDKKLSPRGFVTVLNNIEARISKVMLPVTSLKTNFSLKAGFSDQSAKELGSADLSGWIDFGPKDMDAALKISGLDAIYFEPYYGNLISNKKLSSARVSLISSFKAKNNDLAVTTDFKLTDLAYASDEPSQAGEALSVDLVKNALDLFADEKGSLSLEFTINTKLDKPQVNARELKRTMLRAAAKNLANQPPEVLMEKVNSFIEQFKEFGKQFKGSYKNKE